MCITKTKNPTVFLTAFLFRFTSFFLRKNVI
nr:MAG TPA: La-related protein 1-binding, RNA-binding, DM15, RNA BINDING [Caudoviricetes sp.]